MITLEYILIEGVNDDVGQAELLAEHAKRLNAKVNLIPYNQVNGLEWKRPELSQIRAFHNKVDEGELLELPSAWKRDMTSMRLAAN